jgi:Holliday junction resolvase YEN1
MIEELKTNASSQIGRKNPGCAAKLLQLAPASFLPAHVLSAYLTPSTSSPTDKTQGWPGFGWGQASYMRGKARRSGRGDIEGMARACERFFEWGTKDLVGKKFGGENLGVWLAELVSEARELVDTTLETDPSPPHVAKITGKRNDPTNPDLSEYRLVIDQRNYLARTSGAMEGTRMDPKDLRPEERARLGMKDRTGAEDVVEQEPLKEEVKVWIAEYLVREAWPRVVVVYEEGIRKKEAAKAKRGKKAVNAMEDVEAFRGFFATQVPQASGAGKVAIKEKEILQVEEEEEEVEEIEEVRYLPRLHATQPEPPLSLSSSLSSLSSIDTDSSPILMDRPVSSPILVRRSRATRRVLRIVSPVSSPAPRGTTPISRVRRSINTSSPSSCSSPVPKPAKKTKSKAVTTPHDVIDLCSSDNDTPKVSRITKPRSRSRSTKSPSVSIIPVLTTSTVPNIESSPRRPAPKKATKKITTTSQSQTKAQSLLTFDVVARSSQSASQKSTKPATPTTPASKPAARKPRYVVISETSDEEHIDCTRRAKNGYM